MRDLGYGAALDREEKLKSQLEFGVGTKGS